ncbi:hypothetical protein B0H13DRAFT_934681 [Mycena leptocephala]|nr:hypothetical protein B0H13DRAFT_934681 [Mycena leptocephala]
MSSRHAPQGLVPLATPTPSATATTLDTHQPPTANPPQSPTATSRLPRFLQIDRPPSAASSSASHGTTASHTTSTSNPTSTSSASGRRTTTRFLGLGKYKERECEPQRIPPTLHESLQTSRRRTFVLSSPPSAYGTARSERHFSASTPPPSSNSSSSGHGQQQDLTLARSPSGSGADGPLATRLSGWFAHLPGSTSDLSIAATTISGSLTHA